MDATVLTICLVVKYRVGWVSTHSFHTTIHDLGRACLGEKGVFFRGSVFFSFFFYANIAHRRPRRDGVVVYVNLNR